MRGLTEPGLSSPPGWGRLELLRQVEIRRELQARIAILPIGAIEQHGPHLPIGVDALLATAFAEALAQRLGGVLAPCVTYGARSIPHSGGGPSFDGTIPIRAEGLIAYLRDLVRGFVDNGCSRLVVINGHFENEPFLLEAAESLREKGVLTNTAVLATSWWSAVDEELVGSLFPEGFVGWHAEHAGLTETALMMHLYPETVVARELTNDEPPRAGFYLHPFDAERSTCQGVLSTTQGATAEIGRWLFKSVLRELELEIRDHFEPAAQRLHLSSA